MSTSSAFQDLITALTEFWADRGCLIEQPCEFEVGAGTFHPTTFLRAIGPEPWNVAYVQPVRRPADGRYGDNPNRLQRYYQFQVFLKPSPPTLQEDFIESLHALGIDPQVHDLRFVEDNWESPTLGAWGLGWEVWLDGMEIVQFTYFQQAGGLDCKPVAGELTYGLERIAMHLQRVSDVYALSWDGRLHYGELYHQGEKEGSAYNFEHASIDALLQEFQQREQECRLCLDHQLPIPAYEQAIKASHVFNLLDARRALSVTERQRCMLRVRRLSSAVAETYLQSRKAISFPLLEP